MCREAECSVASPDRPEVPLQIHALPSAPARQSAAQLSVWLAAMFLLLICLSSTGQAQAPLAEPNNSPAWTNLGESRMQQGKFDEAIAAFSRAESMQVPPVPQRGEPGTGLRGETG